MMFDHVKNFNFSILFLISIFDSDSEPGYIYMDHFFFENINGRTVFSVYVYVYRLFLI